MSPKKLAASIYDSALAADYTLDFYLDSKNIADQDIVAFIISHFETNRQGIFTPLEFLNIVWKQTDYTLKNSHTPFEVRKKLNALPLNDEQKHILYFFIIYWFGGVSNMNPQLAHTLRLIENEFKLYKRDSLEKQIYFKGLHQFEKLTFQQRIELKLKFDKLPYSGKLDFWEKNYLPELGLEFTTRGFYLENEIDTSRLGNGINPENSISIFPKDRVELEQYNSWLLKHCMKDPLCDFEKIKINYFEKIKNNPRALEFTELEIDSIKKQRDTGKRFMEGKSSIIVWGFYYGYLSVVKNENLFSRLGAEESKSICLSYSKGVAAAHYLGFLEARHEELRRGGNILPQKGRAINENTDNNQILGKFLNRDDYFQIILEIYELERITISDYLEDKFQKLISKNPDFVKCLYKDIYYVLDNVHKEGDLDLFIENGDIEVEYGDIKITGKSTNLDYALTWLHGKLIEGFMKIDPLKWQEHLKHFENEFLNIDYNTPAYTKKLSELNNELRKLTGNAPQPDTPLQQDKKSSDSDHPYFKPGAIKRLGYTNANSYILADKIEEFKLIELELLRQGFLDQNGSWIEAKNKLCALIHLLHGIYLKTKLPKKETWPSLLCYRRFFEERYIIDISKAFQESQFPPGSVKNFIPYFKLVFPPEDLK